MALNAELALSTLMKVVIRLRDVNSVTRQASHDLAVPRIDDALADWMCHRVLVRVAVSAKLDRVERKQERTITTVCGMASIATQPISMTQETPFELRCGTPGVVAGEAESWNVILQEFLSAAAVSVMAGRTSGSATRHVGEHGFPRGFDLFFVTGAAKFVLSNY